ncbi:MAG: hypothetical protein IJG50_03435 [Clostridia bacterium]|nr:hypothetical protein [Clostridia bacterium]
MTYKKLLVMFIIGILLVGIGAGVTVIEFGSYVYKGAKTIEESGASVNTERYEISLPKSAGIRSIRIMPEIYDPGAQNEAAFSFVEDDKIQNDLLIVEISSQSSYMGCGTASEEYLLVSGERKDDFGYDSTLGRYYYYDYGQKDEYVYYEEETYDDTSPYAEEDVTVGQKIYPEDGQYVLCADVTVYTYPYRSTLFSVFGSAQISDVLEDLKHKEIYRYEPNTEYSVTVYANSATLSDIEH